MLNYPNRRKERDLMMQSQYKVNTPIVKVNVAVSSFFIFPKFLLSCIIHLFAHTHLSHILLHFNRKCGTSNHYSVKLTVLHLNLELDTLRYLKYMVPDFNQSLFSLKLYIFFISLMQIYIRLIKKKPIKTSKLFMFNCCAQYFPFIFCF